MHYLLLQNSFSWSPPKTLTLVMLMDNVSVKAQVEVIPASDWSLGLILASDWPVIVTRPGNGVMMLMTIRPSLVRS